MNSSGLVVSPQMAPPGILRAGERSRRTALAPVLVVVALTVAGAAIRVVVAHQSVFADELSTYWISATHGLGGVLSLLYGSGRIAHAEITPPLSFLLSWLTTRFGETPELLRIPALLAGTATIPLIYALGLRAVGRRAALVAAGLTAFSPFMIYYSAEARAYGLMMCFVVGATLALLLAIDTGRRRWWVVYAVSSAAAFYSHYTSLFVLATALLWGLWAHPECRRQMVLANLGAALLAVPWIPGLINDLGSPTVRILSALSPFTVHDVRLDIEHWAIGFPYTVAGRLPDLPGVTALALLGCAGLVAVAGLAARAVAGWREIASSPRPSALLARLDRRIVLVLALLLATPIAEAIVSASGNHILGVRDLAASWPFLALAAAAALSGAGPRLGVLAGVLAVVAFALGASKLFESRFQRPNFQAAADYVAEHAGSADVVLDATPTPGPLTGLDITLHRNLQVFRILQPAERDHPFGFSDPSVTIPAAVSQALAAAHGARVFVVGPARLGSEPFRAQLLPVTDAFPARYRLVTLRSWNGIVPTVVAVYAARAQAK